MEQSYKEKYEDILARLERAKNDNDVCDERFCCVIDDLIPELAESEDEKVRKWCISHFKECINVIKDNDEYKEYLSNKVLAWLEKQGEQKFEMKTAEESLGISSDEYNKIVDECLFGEQKLTEFERGLFDMLTDISKPCTADCVKSYSEKLLSIARKMIALEQKPEENKGNIGGISAEWSKDDETHVNSLLKRLEGLCRKEFATTRFAISEDKEWLKSLKERIGGKV